MTQLANHDAASARRIDRLCELTSIGAGHAAGAFAALLGRAWEMRVPRARVLEAGELDAPLAQLGGADASECSGVIFEVQGGLGGVLGLLWPPASRDALLNALLGENASIEAQAQSALQEVANIAASHFATALGQMLGESVLISVPQLETSGAPAAFIAQVAANASQRPVLRIEIALRDRATGHEVLLAYAPSELGA
ncbi:MAG: chemotaxis protein CheC [Deltaproteobacteria bacterium]|nr:chemotaxis protein CheC [Deltaproteobacteria bacterium]